MAREKSLHLSKLVHTWTHKSNLAEPRISYVIRSNVIYNILFRVHMIKVDSYVLYDSLEIIWYFKKEHI
jgi:hypothetical protein